MQVPFYIFIKPLFFMAAIVTFWFTVKRRADSRWRFAAILGALFVISVALSVYEAMRPVDAVVSVAGESFPYAIVKALLENVGLFAIVALLLSLLTVRLARATREVEILANVAAGSADAIVAFDLAGTITSWNLGAEMLFCYYADEIVGSRVDRVIDENYLAEFRGAIQRCKTQSFIRSLPCRLLGKGRKPILAEATLSPFMDDLGKTLGMSLFIRDVTERKKIEEELLQASKLSAMGAMAAGIVHEFGNLLTVIAGRAQLGKTAPSIEEARGAFEAIAACAARANSVTNNLLAYAKRQKPRKTRGRIRDAVDAALALLEKELERAGITVEHDYGDVPPTAFDHEQMTQVFANLLINALNAMRSGGGKITVTVSLKNSYVETEVRDTGPGIPDEIMPGLFEPFSTGGGESPHGPRTGLGLFVCREIVKFHSGSITVESGCNRGTAFRVYLPVAADAVPSDVSDTRLFAAGQCRVAVIDRDAMMRDLLAEALRRRGMTVSAFQDFSPMAASGPFKSFDLVFVDISVRDSSGARFIERLKADKGPGLVGMVGEAVDAEELRAIEDGILSTLRKPFGLDQVNAVCDMIFTPDNEAPDRNTGKKSA